MISNEWLTMNCQIDRQNQQRNDKQSMNIFRILNLIEINFTTVLLDENHLTQQQEVNHSVDFFCNFCEEDLLIGAMFQNVISIVLLTFFSACAVIWSSKMDGFCQGQLEAAASLALSSIWIFFVFSQFILIFSKFSGLPSIAVGKEEILQIKWNI